MKSVVEYLDYRKFISDFYSERKAMYGFTWREFARIAGFSNPVYLKQVADGKYNLSTEAAERVAKAVDLVGIESTYFKLLVSFSNAKNDRLRQAVFVQMQAIAKKRKSTALIDDVFKLFKSWKYSVIRELAVSMDCPTPVEISKMCYPEIPTGEVSAALKLMCKLGVLVQDGTGNYHQTSKVLSMMDEAKPVASTNLQREMGNLALDALSELPFAERSMSGLTIGISSKNYERIVKEIADFRKRITSIVVEDEKTEQVYRLNLQFFPLSKKLKK